MEYAIIAVHIYVAGAINIWTSYRSFSSLTQDNEYEGIFF